MRAAKGSTPGSQLLTDGVWMAVVWTLWSAFEQDKHALMIAVRIPLARTVFAF